jgi:glycosyltransferase involved in cell wall biosynthesis
MCKLDLVSLIVPTLNEVNGLKNIMPKIDKRWVDQIIILDGKSSDGSIEWCEQQGYDIYTQKESGMWNAYRELYLSGMIKGDIVVTFSPDGNSIPEAIPQLVRRISSGFDMVIGSRYLDGHESPDDTFLTKIGNKVFTKMCDLACGYNYTDALVMLRAYRKDIIEKLGFLDNPNWLQRQLIKMSPLYGWESSLSIRAKKKGYIVSEIYAIEPKAFRKRRQSTLIHGFVIGTQIIHEWLRG